MITANVGMSFRSKAKGLKPAIGLKPIAKPDVQKV